MLPPQALFSEVVEVRIRRLAQELEDEKGKAARMLASFIDLFNQVRAAEVAGEELTLRHEQRIV